MEEMKILGRGESAHIDTLSYFATFPHSFATFASFAPLRWELDLDGYV